VPIRWPAIRWPRRRNHPTSADSRCGVASSGDDARAAVQALVLGFAGPLAQTGAIVSDDALTKGRFLLAQAIRPVGEDVEIEADLLALVAWLHWARWTALPDGADVDDLETALRLFMLLSWVDPDGLGRRERLPEEFRSAVSAERLDAASLLIDQARCLLDGLAHRVHAADLDLMTVVTDAALLLVPDDDPGRADLWANLAAARHIAFRQTGNDAYLEGMVAAGRRAVAECRDRRAVRPHLVNLAIALADRYQVDGQPEALEESLTVLDGVLADGAGADADVDLRVRALSAHAAASVAAAGATGDVTRLDLAVERYRSAAALCLDPGAPAKTRSRYPTYLTNLADVLRQRHDHGSDRHDLDEAIALAEDVVNRTSEHDTDLPRRQAVLASVLSVSEPADLDRAVRLFASAYSETDTADPRRASTLTNLGHALVLRHEREGGWADLRRGLAAHRLAAILLPARSPTRAEVHGNHGVALARWYDRTARLDLLDEAVHEIGTALDGVDVGPARMGVLLANLAGLRLASAERRGRDDDLSGAISAARESVALTASTSPDLSRRLANLALALEQEFDRRGDPSVLDEAVATHRRAVHTAPAEPGTRAHHLGSLASALVTRFWLRGAEDDLDEAVALHQEAIDAMPPVHPDRPRLMGNLASALLTRSRHTDSDNDARNAADLMRSAVRNTNPGGTDLPYRLDTLGASLGRLAELTDDPAIAEEAVEACSRAIALTAPEDRVLQDRLRHRGDGQELRFRLTGEREHLDAAIDSFVRAEAASPPESLDRALNQHNLADALAARLELDPTRTDDRIRAIAAWRCAATNTVAPVRVRLAAAAAWGRTAAGARDADEADQAFALAIRLLPRLSWLGIPRSDRERQLSEWPELAGDAGAVAIDARAPARAVKLLDAARSIMWQQLLQLHTDTDRLAAEHPGVAGVLAASAAGLRLLEHQRAPGLVRNVER